VFDILNQINFLTLSATIRHFVEVALCYWPINKRKRKSDFGL